MPTKQTPLSPYIGMVFLAILFTVGIIYSHNDLAFSIDDLYRKNHSISVEVSDIRIKSDETANQLSYIIKDIYRSEITLARDIADSAGYGEYSSFVMIDGYGNNFVKLRNTLTNAEITVDINQKVITTHDVDY